MTHSALPHRHREPLFSHLIHALIGFVRHNTVFCIAFLAALATLPLVPPSRAYLDYLDYRTLACLFATLAVVGALKNVSFFLSVAKKIVRTFRTLRSASVALVIITFVGSMLIANDMALITFLPLGWLVLKETNNQKYTAFIFIMQNISANLGGMLTPFGNPQNLYLYSHFNIPTAEFTRIMFPPFLLAVLLIIGITYFLLPKASLQLSDDGQKPLPTLRVTLYLVLFAMALCMVFRLIPVILCISIIVIALAVMDRHALLEVDYPLLLTFVCFFIFASNMSRIDAVQSLFSSLLSREPLLFSVLSCQFISNVPSAILLSNFTGNYAALLIGVNIGGAGTLIASLASLITFREFGNRQPNQARRYILLFSVLNFSILGILFLFSKFVLGY